MKLKIFTHKKSTRAGLMCLFTYLCLIPLSASADVTSALTALQTILMGAWGKLAATIAIIALGFGCFVMGKVSKVWFISIVIGIGIVFGAPTLVALFSQ